MDPTCPGNKAKSGFGHGEAGSFSGDKNIGSQGRLKATTDRHAVHRRDNRFGTLKATGNSSKDNRFTRLTSGGRCRRRFKVVARREGPVACSGQNGNPAILILLEIIEDFV